jgi:hypothetical protein
MRLRFANRPRHYRRDRGGRHAKKRLKTALHAFVDRVTAAKEGSRGLFRSNSFTAVTVNVDLKKPDPTSPAGGTQVRQKSLLPIDVGLV